MEHKGFSVRPFFFRPSTACVAALAVIACLVAPVLAQAALVRVNLGIYGGLAKDMAAYEDSGGSTRVIVAVDGDIGGVRLNNAGTAWLPIFYGRPGAINEIEADVTDSGVGSGAGVVYALLNDGKLVANNSDQTGAWTRAAWATVTGGGTFVSGSTVVEAITTVVGHSSGTYVGTEDGNVYRSTDGGANWSLLATPVALARVESIAAYVDDATNPTLYATVDNAGTVELYPMTYGGSSYAVGSAMSVAGGAVAIERVFVYPDAGITDAPLLFVTGDSPSQSVYRGPNDGASWSTVTYAMHYFQQMVFDATNAMIYAVSGYSDDLGLTWNMLPNYTRTEGDIHSNDGTMALDPTNSSSIYYASDWFVGNWTESSGTWTANGELATNTGVTAILINDMDQIPDTTTTKDTFIIGGKSGIGITADFLSHSGAHPTWTYPIYPDDDGAPVSATRLQDYDGDGATMENVFAGNDSGRLYRSTTQGLTAAAYTQVFDVATDAAGYYVDDDRVRIRDIVESTSSLDDMWFAFGDWDSGNIAGGIACSTDNGVTWQVDPAWVTMGDSMLVNALMYTNTRFWAGVGKYDDADPNHMGIYYKTGSLAGCGTGNWVQSTTGTALDSSIVYDLDGSTSSITYAASSAGLFRGTLSSGTWTWAELTGSSDPALATLPNNPADEYVAVAVNPSPSGYDEEFYAATGDQIYRLRLLGTTWTVNLISPSPHEEVRVLLWDDLVVGSNGTVSALGVPTKAQRKCRKAVSKARSNYIGQVLKASVTCRDAYLGGGDSCPDAKAAAAIAKAEAKVALDRRCTDGAVAALDETWYGGCLSVRTVEDLEACLLADLEEATDTMILAEYGAEDPGRVGVAVGCQRAIGRAYGRGYASKAIKAMGVCEGSIDKGRTVDCPDAKAQSKIEKAATKAAARIVSGCSASDLTALDGLGFGGSCSGLGTFTDLSDCQLADHEDALDALLSRPEDAF